MNKLFVDPDIEKASTLPAHFYTSLDWYEQVKEKIFAKTWQFCLGTESLRLNKQLVPFFITRITR